MTNIIPPAVQGAPGFITGRLRGSYVVGGSTVFELLGFGDILPGPLTDHSVHMSIGVARTGGTRQTFVASATASGGDVNFIRHASSGLNPASDRFLDTLEYYDANGQRLYFLRTTRDVTIVDINYSVITTNPLLRIPPTIDRVAAPYTLWGSMELNI